eukprot:TRINITY_DN12265_c0_g1_i1.p1 TRINITY_DN12265_c0_g1~~TRINITY_DN12265_c0_g1_i1.p1  ORF type:complete len:370 (-),score=60.86 TRINITY_DN12265_c0_g1_i1:305-1414(-)
MAESTAEYNNATESEVPVSVEGVPCQEAPGSLPAKLSAQIRLRSSTSPAPRGTPSAPTPAASPSSAAARTPAIARASSATKLAVKPPSTASPTSTASPSTRRTASGIAPVLRSSSSPSLSLRTPTSASAARSSAASSPVTSRAGSPALGRRPATVAAAPRAKPPAAVAVSNWLGAVKPTNQPGANRDGIERAAFGLRQSFSDPATSGSADSEHDVAPVASVEPSGESASTCDGPAEPENDEAEDGVRLDPSASAASDDESSESEAGDSRLPNAEPHHEDESADAPPSDNNDDDSEEPLAESSGAESPGPRRRAKIFVPVGYKRLDRSSAAARPRSSTAPAPPSKPSGWVDSDGWRAFPKRKPPVPTMHC